MDVGEGEEAEGGLVVAAVEKEGGRVEAKEEDQCTTTSNIQSEVSIIVLCKVVTVLFQYTVRIR